MTRSLSRMASAENPWNDSAQSPPTSRKARPSCAAARASVRVRASPAKTRGGRVRSSAQARSSASPSGHSGCCSATRSRHDAGDQPESKSSAVDTGSEVAARPRLVAEPLGRLDRPPAAHLLELLLGGRLLGEEGGLDPVEEALEPADE